MVGRGVVVFSKEFCPYCHKAKNLFEKIGVPFKEILVDDWKDEDVSRLKIESKHKTFPNIFVGKTHVGGFDSLKLLHESQQLFDLLKQADVDRVPPQHQNL